MPGAARIIFAGSPDFAVPTLDTLLASSHDVVAVLTQPDRPAGRGRRLQAGPVKQVAVAAGVPVLQPATLADSDIQSQLERLQPDLLVVVAYGLLLPPQVLALPTAGCVNVHASLLPRWRGASPIQMAVLAGDESTGVCIMQMDAGLDTGPVYACEQLTIGRTETAGELHDRLAVLGGKLLGTCLDPILAGELQPEPQSDEGVTYAARLRKIDAVIDWQQSAVSIDRAIRAYIPWPVAQTTLHGTQLRCWSAEVAARAADRRAEPGAVLGVNDAGILVQTGDGVLLLTEVQAPGRKRLAANLFANAGSVSGAVLGK